MEERHEIINFDIGSPIKVFMHKPGNVNKHWHESLELLFVLTGEVTIRIGTSDTLLRPEDVYLINRNTIHELRSEDCVMIAVQIKLSKFNLPSEMVQDMFFDCNSAPYLDKSRFLKIKQLIAGIVRSSSYDQESTLLQNRAFSYALLTELFQNFKADPLSGESDAVKHLSRLNHIITYIADHYAEGLTLTQVAGYAHLSPPYLSSFFEKYMGVNFSAYYTGLRLDHAVQQLLYTNDSVEQIALACGFSDSRAFVRAFKKYFGMLPSQYRRDMPAKEAESTQAAAINYLELKPDNYLHLLSQYIPQDSPSLPAASGKDLFMDFGSVDCTLPGTPIKHKWKTLVGVGRAKELMFDNVRKMLSELQRKVGFKYICFHGIFSDDMMVCTRDRKGKIYYSFLYIDQIFDYLLSIGIKPFVQFSFMPAALAKEPERTVFDNPFIISLPKDLKEWEDLVSTFVQHIIRRYGKEEVRSWLFNLWNEPETSTTMFGFEDRTEFFRLYESTYRAVKEADSELVIGTPSIFPVSELCRSWLTDFLKFSRENSCMPEFMDVHYYSDDFSSINMENPVFSKSWPLSSDPQHFDKYLAQTLNTMENTGIKDLPLYVTEWNLTVSHRSLINDSCFKAVYTAKNFLENIDRAESFGYWCLTDLIEEYQPDAALFHGGMGLFTRTGLKKPAVLAMELMARLGDELLAKGDGYFVTRKGDSYQVLLYNYEHPNVLFVQEGFGITETDRSGVFSVHAPVTQTIALKGIKNQLYQVRESFINEQNGSVFDAWAELGAPAMTGADETEYLAAKARPTLIIGGATISDGIFTFQGTLNPLEVRLIEIIPEEGR
ncbi:MAG: helix-turn-helix domain-containing protein [Parasporobacterium sp.]|nr:helix-turn-helix domain-containing protein [Parasporobacterium sp.]